MRHPARPLPLALLLALPLVLAPGLRPAVAAEPPRIVASIGPLQGLAAMVAGDVSGPTLLIPGNASPHSYSLRPSDARALAGADLVIWIGPALESFLAEPLDSLAVDARRMTVADLPGLNILPARKGGVWGEHEHDHDTHGHDGHARDEGHDHDEHAHDQGHDHDEHAHGEDNDHADATFDAHLWLDPANAMVIVDAIAATLVEIDPDHATAYRDNARAAQARLAALDAALASQLAPVADKPFVVFHDAYQYLEARYGLAAVGAVTVSPDIQPGARRLGELREEIANRNAVCIFAEPQFPPRVIELIAGETGAQVGVLDPLGADIEPGPEAYVALMERLGAAAAECLAGPA